jgi:hypothetical protein
MKGYGSRPWHLLNKRRLLASGSAVIEVPNCQIASQLLKYFSEVQPFARKLSRERLLLIPRLRASAVRHIHFARAIAPQSAGHECPSLEDGG